MQQGAQSSNGLKAENNDDRVLQCCLQYQLLYPGCAVILCTNDKNLCSKALLSGVQAFSKDDLETEVARSDLGSSFLQNIQTFTTSAQTRCSLSTLTPVNVRAQEAHGQETTNLPVEKERNQPSKTCETSSEHLSSLVCEFESSCRRRCQAC
ncbi:hypothetical protein WMY93_024850 [Mugilogobius chulae]|uniref:PIN domain-containing protein n=1 Tax=Mugilogobius chulae TaxID=88201 RepID=A0AAW0N5L1_9GOBI